MARKTTTVLCCLLAATAALGAGGRKTAEEYYFVVEVNGVRCGYTRATIAPILEGGRALTLLRQETIVRATLLGGKADSRLQLTYHLDPPRARSPITTA